MNLQKLLEEYNTQAKAYKALRDIDDTNATKWLAYADIASTLERAIRGDYKYTGRDAARRDPIVWVKEILQNIIDDIPSAEHPARKEVYVEAMGKLA